MTSLSVTIQIKALEEFFPTVLFGMLKMTLTFSFVNVDMDRITLITDHISSSFPFSNFNFMPSGHSGGNPSLGHHDFLCTLRRNL